MENRQLILKWYKRIKAIKKLGGKCEKCKTKNVKHLIFHHLKDKDEEISSLMKKSWTNIELEISKCILLCHNCHLELHFKEKILNNGKRISKKMFIEYKGGECVNCKYNKCQAALTFHHVEKTDKCFNINRNMKIFRTISEIEEDIIKELDKCIILCGNCHNEQEINNNYLDYVVSNFDKINLKKKSSKIDRDKVRNMYFVEGLRQVDISKILNVSKGTISDIIKKF